MRKKTHEQFVKEVYEKMGSDYLVKGKYVDSKTKLEVKHLKCGHEYMVQPSKIVNVGRGCPKCNYGGSAKMTQEEFEGKVFNLVGNEYKVLGEYKGSSVHIRMRHNKCENEYVVAPTKFLCGKRCPKCKGGVRSNIDEFVNRVYGLVKDEYEVLGEYINARTKIEIKHNECGQNFSMTPECFIRGQRCSACNINSLKTNEEFLEDVYNLVKKEYSVMGTYKGIYTKIKMRHNKCGHNYLVSPSDFQRGRRCPNCFQNKKKTSDLFKKQVFDLVENEYEVIEEYISTNSKIKMKHNKCGFEYKVKPAHFLYSGSRCPRCIFSKGERTIENWLETNNIEYETQYKFDDCKHKLKLPFDFAIFRHNELIMLVEYDGKQHYKPIKRFGGEEGFKLVQERDNVKNKYCLQNNIPLLRIPYWEFDNINKLLRKAIQSYCSMQANGTK
ncbi:hypothetical protein MMB68_25480 [Priestia sp. Y58]|uniref:hypothetical protein n=1 Tax=Priestia sp. Y58 TaxID=2922804 RepID=UPI0024064982|nr:hypothetical protein [Priestia sp. Y58]MDG0032905.1 hypothetical protein [Priestia sp. Y58]